MKRTQTLLVSLLGQVCEHRERERQVELLLERELRRQEFGSRQRRGNSTRATDVENPLHRVAGVEAARSDVACQIARQTPPAAPEVEHARARQRKFAVAFVAVSQ